jgi:hypothetical protein
MRIFVSLIFAFVLLSCSPDQQPIRRLTVDAADYDRWNTTVLYPLEADVAQSLGRDGHALFEVLDGVRQPVVSQILYRGEEVYLAWVMHGVTPSGQTRTYELDKTAGTTGSDVLVECVRKEKTLDVVCAGKLVLSYWFGEKLPPEGVDPHYRRSGFIHPINSPSGATLTRIQPPDHYHHYGLWNPWTHTLFRGDTIDFWNLKLEEGTVRSKGVQNSTDGEVVAMFTALHEHIDLPEIAGEEETVALLEDWQVDVWPLGELGEEGWIIDFTSELECGTANPFTILAYRYQGFGFRARTSWNDDNCTLLTSEGKNKADGNATRAKWCDVRGPTEAGTSGILFMTHPSNQDFPELLRIWPVGANKGTENVFFNFNPAQDKDWKLLPGNKYRLRYRMFVYDGQIDASLAERLWKDFANTPQVISSKL